MKTLIWAVDRKKYDVECECKCDSGTYAYTYTWFSDTVHFCPDFFTAGKTEQAATFGHELSHLFIDTKDDYSWTDPTKRINDSLDLAQLYEDAVRFGSSVSNVESTYKRWISATK